MFLPISPSPQSPFLLQIYFRNRRLVVEAHKQCSEEPASRAKASKRPKASQLLKNPVLQAGRDGYTLYIYIHVHSVNVHGISFHSLAHLYVCVLKLVVEVVAVLGGQLDL